MRRATTATLVLAGLCLALVPFFALVGLGLHRHAAAWAVPASAGLLVLGPPFGMAAAASRERAVTFGAALAAWSLALLAVLPVYFPGERNQAILTGLSVTRLGSAPGLERLAESLPEEPKIATPEIAEAASLTVDPPPPATATLADNQIALPYEGEGRRMTVPVIFGNAGTELEVDMMLDTGATYTTLSTDALGHLGIHPSDDDPIIRLHTANGDRDARVVLVDEVWLGDLRIEGVALATCDDCASTGTVGLLGLNVTGGFNLAIDADRREVLFTHRARFDRQLDVKPFSDLSATFTRFPGGRVEVTVHLENLARRAVRESTTSIRCGSGEWSVALGAIPPGERATARRKLPPHDACEQYEIALHHADW